MKFVRCLICVMFLLFSFPAFAADGGANINVDLTKLSNEARNEILNKLEKEKAAIATVVTPDNISALGTIAVDISNCIRDVAKNLNVEVNNFAQTPVGFMTFGLIIWNYFGSTIILSLFETINGFFVWFILTGIYIYIARRTFLPSKLKHIKFGPDGKKTSEDSEFVYPYNEHDKESVECKNLWAFLGSIIYCAGTLVILLSAIL